jgi:hypothetical protein
MCPIRKGDLYSVVFGKQHIVSVEIRKVEHIKVQVIILSCQVVLSRNTIGLSPVSLPSATDLIAREHAQLNFIFRANCSRRGHVSDIITHI